jgi:hypothetical protein
VDELKHDLGLPNYVSTEYFPMKRAIVTLWAAKHAHELHNIVPDVRKRVAKKPLKLILFGGAAFKIRCPSCNVTNGPFNRPINDVDFVMPKKSYKEIKSLLLELSEICGTEYLCFMTHHDGRFSSLQAGNRILLRAFDEITPEGTPVVGPVDILADRIEMRHTIDVRDDLENAAANMFTISPLNLLLTKTQFIFPADIEMKERFQKAGEAYRILPYEFGKKILVGMERKDFMDVAALLLDHGFGSASEEINIEALRRTFKGNDKLALTVSLNLQNMLSNLEMVKGSGATENQVAMIEKQLRTLLDDAPEIRHGRNGPWWNTAVETPKIPF